MANHVWRIKFEKDARSGTNIGAGAETGRGTDTGTGTNATEIGKCTGKSGKEPFTVTDTDTDNGTRTD